MSQPKWEHKTKLGIHSRMEEVVKLTIQATQQQIALERKKLRKLKYGS